MVDLNFCSHQESSAVSVLLFWSLPCIEHDQHNGHPFFIVVSHSFCPAVFFADSCQVTFSILLRQDAVILFNCRSVTITCCNSTATCAPVSSLTAGINSRFISLHQLTGKIPENSVTKVTKCRRQSYCDKSSVSRLTFSSRLQSPSVVYFTSQPHFFT